MKPASATLLLLGVAAALLVAAASAKLAPATPLQFKASAANTQDGTMPGIKKGTQTYGTAYDYPGKRHLYQFPTHNECYRFDLAKGLGDDESAECGWGRL